VRDVNDSAAVDLHWLPLGAGARLVRRSGSLYEWFVAHRQHRPCLDLYHAAMQVHLDGDRYVVELAPVPDLDGAAARGVVGAGAVGLRALGRLRWFRYELRRWADGTIPDLEHAVDHRRLTTDPTVAGRILDGVCSVPTPVWGRDELRAGEMWNSNSVIAWLLVRAGIPVDDLAPPPGGRAPGWRAGVEVAHRTEACDTGRYRSGRCRPSSGMTRMSPLGSAPRRRELPSVGHRPPRRPWGSIDRSRARVRSDHHRR
jgi:hypothetical protein